MEEFAGDFTGLVRKPSAFFSFKLLTSQIFVNFCKDNLIQNTYAHLQYKGVNYAEVQKLEVIKDYNPSLLIQNCGYASAVL